MTRSFAVGGVLALVAGAAFLSRDWDDEGEMMRLVGRSDDATSVKDAELGGLRGRLARAKIRAEDHLDVGRCVTPLLPCYYVSSIILIVPSISSSFAVSQ